jgi:hypothetical protein
MFSLNAHLLRIGSRFGFQSIVFLGRFPTLAPSIHLPQHKPTPTATILKTFHTSCPRYAIDKRLTGCETAAAPEYEYIEDCERLERYRPGGFYPAKLGDQLADGRYSIVHNLGIGGSSTVWLASDQKRQELVAIKIKTADSTSDSQEADILKHFHGQPSMRELLDHFVENSPNGAHDCFVMEAASCSVMQSKSLTYHGLLDLPTARAIAADLVLAVRSLHRQGIVHGGE